MMVVMMSLLALLCHGYGTIVVANGVVSLWSLLAVVLFV